MVEEFKNTELGLIPEDWEVKTLGDISQTYSGGTPNTSNRSYYGGSINFIASGDLNKGRIQNVIGKITKSGFDNSSAKMVPKNTLLIAMYGATAGISAITEIEGAINQAVLAVFPIKTEYKYIFYWWQLNKDKLVRTLTQGGQPNLSGNLIKSVQIPLPPTLAEQTAIATALNDADALISSLEKLIAKKKAMKQGAVQELFKPQKGWQTKSLGDIANIRRGASPRPIKDPKWFSQKGRGWIRISDVTSSNVYLNSTTQYLSEEGVKNSVPVDKGDLIMSICATIGVPVIINIPACIHDGFVLFSNYENYLDTFYLYFFLQKETDTLVGKGQPGTQKNLNISIVSNIEISYPSVEEQKKIGLILKDIDIELSGLEQRLEKQKQLKQGMMQSLLTGKIRLV